MSAGGSQRHDRRSRSGGYGTGPGAGRGACRGHVDHGTRRETSSLSRHARRGCLPRLGRLALTLRSPIRSLPGATWAWPLALPTSTRTATSTTTKRAVLPSSSSGQRRRRCPGRRCRRGALRLLGRFFLHAPHADLLQCCGALIPSLERRFRRGGDARPLQLAVIGRSVRVREGLRK